MHVLGFRKLTQLRSRYPNRAVTLIEQSPQNKLYYYSKVCLTYQNFLATPLNSELIKQMLVEQGKQEREEEKARFDDCKIILDVGGTRFSTSRSTLTKYPESMLGVMFSGRHDLEAMKCSDGSFFIDRDGTHFRHILSYLRDGAKAIHCFPKSHEIMQEILHEAMYYQLEGLVTAAQNRAVSNTISHNDIFQDFGCIESNIFYSHGQLMVEPVLACLAYQREVLYMSTKG